MEEERERNYRQVTSVVAILVCVFGVWYLMFSSSPKKADVICPRFKFNSTTANAKLLLYNEDTKVANLIMEHENTLGEAFVGGRLRNFKGVVGRVVRDKVQEYSYSVGINYRILNKIEDEKLLFQTGLSHPDFIDESAAIGIQKTAWSLSSVGCEGKYVCLVSETAGHRLKSTPISENKPKTKMSLKLTVNVDLLNNRIVYKMMPTSQIVGDFKNVDFTGPPVPVFGVYNPKLANVSMTLLGEDSDVSFDFTQMHSNIYVSSDQKIIANFPQSISFIGGYSASKFQKYIGVMGDIVFSSRNYVPDLPYFYEVVVSINFYKMLLKKNDFIFQIGLSRPRNVDEHKSLTSHKYALIVEMVRCSPTSFSDICIRAWNSGTLVNTTELRKLGNRDPMETTLSFTIELFIKESKVCISLRHSRFYKCVATFNNINFRHPLVPVFGLNENPKVSIQLRTNTDIKRFSSYGYQTKEPVCEE